MKQKQFIVILGVCVALCLGIYLAIYFMVRQHNLRIADLRAQDNSAVYLQHLANTLQSTLPENWKLAHFREHGRQDRYGFSRYIAGSASVTLINTNSPENLIPLEVAVFSNQDAALSRFEHYTANSFYPIVNWEMFENVRVEQPNSINIGCNRVVADTQPGTQSCMGIFLHSYRLIFVNMVVQDPLIDVMLIFGYIEQTQSGLEP